MATDDGAARTDPGDFRPERAIKIIAALYDAMNAAQVPKAGDKPDGEAAERLAWLLIQVYNQLLARAVEADAGHRTRVRFDVVQGLEVHEAALGEAGLRRNGEGGLSLWTNDFTVALSERPISTIKTLRNASGTCAGLAAFVCRALVGIGAAGGLPPEPDLGRMQVSVKVPAPAREPGAASQPGMPRVWVPEPGPTVRVATFQPSQYGLAGAEKPPAQGGERPQYYA